MRSEIPTTMSNDIKTVKTASQEEKTAEKELFEDMKIPPCIDSSVKSNQSIADTEKCLHKYNMGLIKAQKESQKQVAANVQSISQRLDESRGELERTRQLGEPKHEFVKQYQEYAALVAQMRVRLGRMEDFYRRYGLE